MWTKIKTAAELLLASAIAIVLILLLHNPSYADRIVAPLHKTFGTPTIKHPDYDAIIRLANDKGKSFCTGFVLDANYAATAGHCLNDGEGKLRSGPIAILSQNNEDTGIVAQAMGIAIRSDLGLIQGEFSNFKAQHADLEDFGFYHPGPYVTCGFPYLQRKLVCTPFIPLTNLGFAIAGKGYLVPGESGGPVINLRTGKAVGVNSATGDGVVKVFPLTGFLGAFNLQ